ncbi:hypothetical protein D9M68_812690 [compost metagenome]
MVEKFSPLLKFRRLSSAVRVEARPSVAPPLLDMKSLSGLVVDQLPPTDSDESNCPSISPMEKFTA